MDLDSLIEQCKDSFWVLKWKGHRVLDQNRAYEANSFPNQHTYSLAPLTFGSNIRAATGLRVSDQIRLKDGQLQFQEEGDALVFPLYQKVRETLEKPLNHQLQYFAKNSGRFLPELFFKEYLHEGSVIRKWGKERVEVFYRSDAIQAFTAYCTLRDEEMAYSDALYAPMQGILDEIDRHAPGLLHYSLTSGSHSRNWGGGAGNRMSWIDADVDIDLLVNAESKEHLMHILPQLSQAIGGTQPHLWGQTNSHALFEIQRSIPSVHLPITGKRGGESVRYCLFFTSIPQFLRKETDYMRFLMANGDLLRETHPGEFNEFHDYGKKLYPFPDDVKVLI